MDASAAGPFIPSAAGTSIRVPELALTGGQHLGKYFDKVSYRFEKISSRCVQGLTCAMDRPTLFIGGDSIRTESTLVQRNPAIGVYGEVEHVTDATRCTNHIRGAT